MCFSRSVSFTVHSLVTWLPLGCFIDGAAKAERGVVGRCHTWQMTEVGLDSWGVLTPACASNDRSGVPETWSNLLYGDKKNLDIHVPLSLRCSCIMIRLSCVSSLVRFTVP